MKTPRVTDFDPDAKLRALKSPLDQMPAIEKSAARKQSVENQQPLMPSSGETLTEPSSRNPEIQKTSIQEFQISRKQENQNTGIPETQNAGTLGSAKRALYTKATYRLSEEALDAIGEAKRILKRRYQLKVNMEEIVEVAVLEAFKDLEEKQQKSSLVSAFSGKPENKKT